MTDQYACPDCGYPEPECACDERCDGCGEDYDDCACDDLCPGGCGAILRRCKCDAQHEAWAGK